MSFYFKNHVLFLKLLSPSAFCWTHLIYRLQCWRVDKLLAGVTKKLGCEQLSEPREYHNAYLISNFVCKLNNAVHSMAG